MSDIVPIREFARAVGVSDTAIHKTIAAERLTTSVVYGEDGRKRGILLEAGKREWANSQNPNYGRSPLIQPEAAAASPAAGPSVQSQVDEVAGSLANAKRAQAVLRAQQMSLELKKAQGILVEKDKVYRAFFSAGQEVRAALLAVPDRVIDEILAARSRAEAHNVLTEAIHATLDTLSGIYRREI